MTDKNRNRHRNNKRSFQVMLNSDESALLDAVAENLGTATNKELLLALLNKSGHKPPQT